VHDDASGCWDSVRIVHDDASECWDSARLMHDDASGGWDNTGGTYGGLTGRSGSGAAQGGSTGAPQVHGGVRSPAALGCRDQPL